jgi:hypothetical protein
MGYLVFQNLGSLWGMRLRSENSRLNSGGASSPLNLPTNDKAEKNTTELKRELLGSQ